MAAGQTCFDGLKFPKVIQTDPAASQAETIAYKGNMLYIGGSSDSASAALMSTPEPFFLGAIDTTTALWKWRNFGSIGSNKFVTQSLEVNRSGDTLAVVITHNNPSAASKSYLFTVSTASGVQNSVFVHNLDEQTTSTLAFIAGTDAGGANFEHLMTWSSSIEIGNYQTWKNQKGFFQVYDTQDTDITTHKRHLKETNSDGGPITQIYTKQGRDQGATQYFWTIATSKRVSGGNECGVTVAKYQYNSAQGGAISTQYHLWAESKSEDVGEDRCPTMTALKVLTPGDTQIKLFGAMREAKMSDRVHFFKFTYDEPTATLSDDYMLEQKLRNQNGLWSGNDWRPKVLDVRWGGSNSVIYLATSFNRSNRDVTNYIIDIDFVNQSGTITAIYHWAGDLEVGQANKLRFPAGVLTNYPPTKGFWVGHIKKMLASDYGGAHQGVVLPWDQTLTDQACITQEADGVAYPICNSDCDWAGNEVKQFIVAAATDGSSTIVDFTALTAIEEAKFTVLTLADNTFVNAPALLTPWINEEHCTEIPSNPFVTAPGSAADATFQPGDPMLTHTFVGNSITSTTCTDEDAAWSYSIASIMDAGGTAMVYGKAKIGLDSSAKNFFFYTDQPIYSTYTVTIKGRLPTGEEQSFTFLLYYWPPCDSSYAAIITTPAFYYTFTHTMFTQTPTTWTFPAVTVDNPNCVPTYTLTYSFSLTAGFPDIPNTVLIFDPVTRLFSIQIDAASPKYWGRTSIEMTFVAGATTKVDYYSFEVVNPCETLTWAWRKSDLLQDMTYTLFDADIIESWTSAELLTPAFITNDLDTATYTAPGACTQVLIDIVNSDGSVLVASMMSRVVAGASQSFTVSTTNFQQVGAHPLKVNMYHQDFPANVTPHAFTVTIVDVCSTQVAPTTPLVVADFSYTMKDPLIDTDMATKGWSQPNTFCPIGYDCSFSKDGAAAADCSTTPVFDLDGVLDGDALAPLDGVLQTGPVTTYDSSLAGVYLITIGVHHNPKVDPTTIAFEIRTPYTFTVTVIDPCAAGVSAPTLSDMVFLLGSAAQVMSVEALLTLSDCPYTLSIAYSPACTICTDDTLLDGDIVAPNDANILVQQAVYDASVIDTYVVTIVYNWSVAETATKTFNLDVTDPCETQVAVIPLQHKTYELQATGFTEVDMSPYVHPDFTHCAVTMTMTTSPACPFCTLDNTIDGDMVAPADFFFLADSSASAYDPSLAGTYVITITYGWSKAQVAARSFNLVVTDPCVAEVVPSDLQDKTYTFGDTFSEYDTRAAILSSYSFCTYTIAYSVSPTCAVCAYDSTVDGDATAPADYHFLADDSALTYDPNNAGTFTISLVYNWAAAETITKTFDLVVTDPCITQLTPITIANQAYTLKAAGFAEVDSRPTINSGYAYCTYAISYSVSPTCTFCSFDSTVDGDATAPADYHFLVDDSAVAYTASNASTYTISLVYSWARTQTVTKTFDLVVTDPCIADTPVYSANSLVDQSYTWRDPAQKYTFASMPMTFSFCEITYTFSAVDSNGAAFDISSALTFDGILNGDTDDQSFIWYDMGSSAVPAADYVVTVTATDLNGDTASGTFTVTMIDPCGTATMGIATAKFPDEAYDFPLATHTLAWIETVADPVCSSTLPETDCGNLIYELVNPDGTALDSNLFTLVITGGTGGSLDTFSNNDRDHIKVHQIQVLCYHTGYKAINEAKHTFNRDINTQLCESTGVTGSQLTDKTGQAHTHINYVLTSSPVKFDFEFTTQETGCPFVQMVMSASHKPNSTYVDGFEDLTTHGARVVRRSLLPTVAPAKQRTLNIYHDRVDKWEGEYDVWILADTGVTTETIPFSIKAINPCRVVEIGVSSLTNDTIYLFSEDAIELVFDEFTHDGMSSHCDLTWTYTVQLFDGTKNLPETIKFIANERKFVIEGYFQQSELVLLEVTGKLSDHENQERKFVFMVVLEGDVKVPYIPSGNLAPILVPPPTGLTVPSGQTTRVELGMPKDFEGDGIMAVCLVEDPNILECNTDDVPYMVTVTSKIHMSTSYKITLMLRDTNDDPKETDYEFYVNVKPVELDFITAVTNNTTARKRTSFINPKLKIVSVDSYGLVRVQCSKILLEPANWTEHLNKTVLDFEIVAAPDQDPELFKFNWTIVAYGKRTIKFQLDFANPAVISQGPLKDMLKMTLVKENATLWFIDEQGQTFTEDTLKEPLFHVLPNMLKNDTLSTTFGAVGNTVAGSSKALLAVNLVVNILLSGSLALLWGMINALQLIVHMPMFAVNFPANAQMLNDAFMSIANFEVIDTDPIIDWVLSLIGIHDEGEEPVNSNFEKGGFKSANILKNLGIAAIAGFFFLLAVTSMVLLRRKIRRHATANKYFEMAWRRVFWNSLIRYALEAYLQYCMAAFINSQDLQYGSWNDTFNSCFAIFLVIVNLLVPFFIWLFMIKNWDNLTNRFFRAKYGSLYTNLYLEDEFNLYYNVVFCLRRVGLCIIIVKFSMWSWFQIQLTLALTTFTMVYTTLQQPFIRTRYNMLEIFNEISIMLCNYHLAIFTDYCTDAEFQYKMGFSFSAVTVMNVSVNMLFLVEEGIRGAIPKIRAKLRIMKEKAAQKKILKAQELAKSLENVEPMEYAPDKSLPQSKKRSRKSGDKDVKFETMTRRPFDSGYKDVKFETMTRRPFEPQGPALPHVTSMLKASTNLVYIHNHSQRLLKHAEAEEKSQLSRGEDVAPQASQLLPTLRERQIGNAPVTADKGNGGEEPKAAPVNLRSQLKGESKAAPTTLRSQLKGKSPAPIRKGSTIVQLESTFEPGITKTNMMATPSKLQRQMNAEKEAAKKQKDMRQRTKQLLKNKGQEAVLIESIDDADHESDIRIDRGNDNNKLNGMGDVSPQKTPQRSLLFPPAHESSHFMGDLESLGSKETFTVSPRLKGSTLQMTAPGRAKNSPKSPAKKKKFVKKQSTLKP